MKRCSHCYKEKPTRDFGRCKSRLGAIIPRTVCKSCQNDQKWLSSWHKEIRDRDALLRAWR